MSSPDRYAPYLIVGRARKAHGIRGEIVVEPITDAPDAIFAPGRRVFAGTPTGDLTKDRQELHVTQATRFKGGLIVAFREIADRNQAELWRDRYFLVPREEAPAPNEGEVYVHELIGMKVVLPTTEPVGEVVDVFELPQGLAIDVRRPTGQTVLMLYDQSVTSVDATARQLTVEPPEGLLD